MPIPVSGISGNEIYCLGLKGLTPGELVVGNSVQSLGIVGRLGSVGRTVVGGEITQLTSLISEGRHSAITRMEEEAKRRGASGVTGVVSELRSLAGFIEFLSQGTDVHGDSGGAFFSTAASGIELYCHLDAHYQPIRFVMGNVAYALGVGRSLIGGLRTLARGEVREFSQMYNGIRHTALDRIRREAQQVRANAVVDVQVRMIPYGPATVELLLTGTASYGQHLGQPSNGVVTSELSGEELWNLASMGYVPVQLVMATSVYSLGVASGISALVRSLARGELPEVTRLVYEARENCMDLLRREAESVGAERVIGNKLQIREIASGLIEVVALGTAVRRVGNATPSTPQLPPQAVIVDRDAASETPAIQGIHAMVAPMGVSNAIQNRAIGAVLAPVIVLFVFAMVCLVGVLSAVFGGKG